VLFSDQANAEVSNGDDGIRCCAALGLTKKMTKKSTAMGFTAVFLAFWAISATVWVFEFKSPISALLAPVAPIYFGCRMLFSAGGALHGFISLAVTGLAAAPITSCLIRGPRLFRVAFGCVMLAVYWILSYWWLRIGIGD
jgi:hypothetical protein